MHTTVGAILLAGTSRKGSGHQFISIGEPAVRHSVQNILDKGIEDIVVVLGNDRWQVAAALTGMPVCMAVNEHPEKGMAESIRIGVAVLPKYVTSIMVAVCEDPLSLNPGEDCTRKKRRQSVNSVSGHQAATGP